MLFVMLLSCCICFIHVILLKGCHVMYSFKWVVEVVSCCVVLLQLSLRYTFTGMTNLFAHWHSTLFFDR